MTPKAATALLLLAFVGLSSVPFAFPAANSQASPQGPAQGSMSRCPVRFQVTVSEQVRVALVNSILTSSAYSNVSYPGVPGFYSFYMKHGATANGSSVNTDLSWLTVPLSTSRSYHGGWGDAYHIYRFMTSDFARVCGLRAFSVIDDTLVDAGSLFYSNGSRRYDVVVAGKSEYVTSNELGQYVAFVRSGGRLVLMDSDNFEVQVKLGSCPDVCETFVNGHGWTFGKAMVHSRVWNAFPAIDSKLTASILPEKYYVGANIGAGSVHNDTLMGLMLYRSFGPRVMSNYSAHEENRLVNGTGTRVVIAFSHGIDSFVHRYGQGDVVCFCLEGSRIIGSEAIARHFLILSISTWRVVIHETRTSGKDPVASLPHADGPQAAWTAAPRRARSAPQDEPAFPV